MTSPATSIREEQQDLVERLREGLANATPGPYEGRDVRGLNVPAGCVDFGVISRSTGREVHRTWAEADARFAELLSPENIRALLDRLVAVEKARDEAREKSAANADHARLANANLAAMDRARAANLARAEKAEAALSRLPASSGTGVKEWRCFHCDEAFTELSCAEAHFGKSELSEPACLIKAGAERSLVKALRRAEQDAADAWHAIHSETTDAAKAYYAQTSRHQEQLRLTEELGYERGLRDAKEHPETLGLARLVSPAEGREPVAFDPMKGGCPHCKWLDTNLGTVLDKKCELHQKIEDLQADLQLANRIAKDCSTLTGKVVAALGGDEEDDPVRLAKERMDELRSFEEEAAAHPLPVADGWRTIFDKEEAELLRYRNEDCQGDNPVKRHAWTVADARLSEVRVLRSKLTEQSHG